MKSLKYFLCLGLLHTSLSNAQIPPELLHQTPTDVPTSQLASIEGFQDTSTALKFINARVYITYINNKATLSRPSDWDKKYSIPQGQTEIRYISDTQNFFGNGRISFEAKPAQHYQIKNNQAQIKFGKEPILFWIENMETGEVVTAKQEINVSPVSTPISYQPVIISK